MGMKNKASNAVYAVAKTAAIAGVIFMVSALFAESAWAAAKTFGEVAARVTGTFGQIAKMITAGAYIAGLGFTVGAILKFKQHKDNPTQIPVGTPIAMLFIAAALVFMPSLLGMTGESLFSGGSVGGPSGIIFTTSGSQ